MVKKPLPRKVPTMPHEKPVSHMTHLDEALQRATLPYASNLPVPVPGPSSSAQALQSYRRVTPGLVARALARLLVKKPTMWLLFTDWGAWTRVGAIVISGGAMLAGYLGEAPGMVVGGSVLAALSGGSAIIQTGLELGRATKRKVLKEIEEMLLEDRGDDDGVMLVDVATDFFAEEE